MQQHEACMFYSLLVAHSDKAMPCIVCVQVSDSLLSLLLADEREALKITSTGLKLFERQEMKGKQTSKCMYRIAQVGSMLMVNGA
jgi:hypothetical protein